MERIMDFEIGRRGIGSGIVNRHGRAVGCLNFAFLGQHATGLSVLAADATDAEAKTTRGQKRNANEGEKQKQLPARQFAGRRVNQVSQVADIHVSNSHNWARSSRPGFCCREECGTINIDCQSCKAEYQFGDRGDSMEIREGSNCLTIEAVDRVPKGLPSDGDVELSVAVASEEFKGHGFAWVGAATMATFMSELRELERLREGEARLEGLSEGEFRLRVWSIDRRGHMAVGGMVTKQVHRGVKSPYVHSLEFGFEFDPTLLPKVLADFESIAAWRAEAPGTALSKSQPVESPRGIEPGAG